MFILFRLISKLIDVLRAGPSPNQIGAGFAMGMFLGLMPFFNFYAFLILVILLLADVNLSAAMLAWLVFSLVAFGLDPLFHDIGYALLAHEGFKPFWVMLYNLPVFPLTKYNNTVVLGSFTVALILALPSFWLARTGIIQYREKLEARIQQSKPFRVIRRFVTGNKIYQWFSRIRRLTR